LNFKEFRLNKKLTQSNVAKLLNLSRSCVAMWEAGKSKPRTDTLIKLLEIYDCTIDDLIQPYTKIA